MKCRRDFVGIRVLDAIQRTGSLIAPKRSYISLRLHIIPLP
jgi:hypothetical protein